jgi:hypothetical protein
MRISSLARLPVGLGLFWATSLVTACGKPEAPAPAPVEPPVAPAPAVPVVTPSSSTPAAPTQPPTAPPATPPTPEQAPTADVAPTPAPEGVVPPPADAPPTAPVAAVVKPELPPVPADLKVPGARDEVVARLLSKEPGCVAIGRESGTVVSIVGGDEVSARVWSRYPAGTTSYGEGDAGFAVDAQLRSEPDAVEIAWTTPEAVLANETLRARLAAADAVPCQTTKLEEGAPVTLPFAKPITAELLAGGVRLFRDGAHPIGVGRLDTDGSEYRYARLYWSPEAETVFVRYTVAASEEVESLVSAPHRVTALPLAALDATCIPRPTEGKPLGAEEAPAFNAAEAAGCIAMTADGKMAALRTYRTSRADRKQSVAPSVAWYGTGTAPDIDLSCYAKRCDKAQQAAAAARATALGLVGCAQVKGPIALDGMKVPFMYQNGQLKLKTGGKFVALAAFEPFAPTGGPETLWKMWQHPAGGPIFVWAGFNDPSAEGVSVRVLDDAGMRLCPK